MVLISNITALIDRTWHRIFNPRLIVKLSFSDNVYLIYNATLIGVDFKYRYLGNGLFKIQTK